MRRVSRFKFVNAYLVPDGEGLILIDTLIPRSAKPILAAAREVGVPITRIVLTHAHQDHVGSLDALAAELPEAEVVISARDARIMAGEHTLDPDEPQDKLRGGFPRVNTRPTRTVEPGERIGPLEVV